MAELTRRRFFFGVGAVAAVAAIPATVGETLIASPPPVAYIWRKITEMIVSFDEATVDACGEVRLIVAGQTVHNVMMNVRGWYRWIPLYDNEPMLKAGQSIELALRSPIGIGRANIICLDKIDHGPPVRLIEEHRFPPNELPKVVQHFFDLDNSLAARLKRQADAEKFDG